MSRQMRQSVGLLCLAAAAFLFSLWLDGLAEDLATVLRYVAGLAAVVSLAFIGLEVMSGDSD